MNKGTDTTHIVIVIVGCRLEHITHRPFRTKETFVSIIKKQLEEPPSLGLLSEKISILPFPSEAHDKQFKFSHHGAPNMRHSHSAIKNYGDKLRAKSKRFTNKRGRR